MTSMPAAARVLQPLLRIDEETGELLWGNRPVPLHARYSTRYIPVLVRGYLYHVPTSPFAWFWHRGSWPAYAVRHINGNKLDFRKDNLRLHSRIDAPQTIAVKRLSAEEAKAYTGLRSGPMAVSTASSRAA